jgi:hypothetical protein
MRRSGRNKNSELYNRMLLSPALSDNYTHCVYSFGIKVRSKARSFTAEVLRGFCVTVAWFGLLKRGHRLIDLTT